MKIFKIIVTVFTLSLLLYINDASAICTGGRCTCAINSPTINFGNSFNPLLGTSLQQTFSNIITVTCTLTSGSSQSVSYTLSFAAGTYGTIANRYMQSSTPNNLNFNVYQDSGFATILGNSGSARITDSYTLGSGGCASPCVRNYSVYGLIPAQSSAFADITQYVDAIPMTLNY